jgi:hypothetical protein
MTLSADLTQRPLQAADLPALHALHAEVMAALPDASMFNLFGGAEAFFGSHFGARGESLGLFRGAQLLAYGALTRPQAADADNYATYLNWPPERAARVALLSAAMVAPGERRQRLHTALIAARLALAQARQAPELLARAAPGNALSRQALMGQGFALVWLGQQAGGLLRHVFWRPATQAVAAKGALTWVAADDLAGQREQLEAGLLGLGTRADAAAIGFGRPGS